MPTRKPRNGGHPSFVSAFSPRAHSLTGVAARDPGLIGIRTSRPRGQTAATSDVLSPPTFGYNQRRTRNLMVPSERPYLCRHAAAAVEARRSAGSSPLGCAHASAGMIPRLNGLNCTRRKQPLERRSLWISSNRLSCLTRLWPFGNGALVDQARADRCCAEIR